MKVQAQTVIVVAAVAAVALLVYKGTQAAGEALDTLTGAGATLVDAINPVNDKNVFYVGAGAIVDKMAGDGSDRPLGVRLWEWLNPGAMEAEKRALDPIAGIAPSNGRPVFDPWVSGPGGAAFGLLPPKRERAAIGGGSRGFY